MKFPLSNYFGPLPDQVMEHQAQSITREVLKVLRAGGDNLTILAAVRRALIDESKPKEPPQSP